MSVCPIEGEYRIICGVFVDQLGDVLRVDRFAARLSGREFVEASACLAIIGQPVIEVGSIRSWSSAWATARQLSRRHIADGPEVNRVRRPRFSDECRSARSLNWSGRIAGTKSVPSINNVSQSAWRDSRS
jgi:hypothetical protein